MSVSLKRYMHIMDAFRYVNTSEVAYMLLRDISTCSFKNKRVYFHCVIKYITKCCALNFPL